MKHYVIISDWCSDCESGVSVKGIAHSLGAALKLLAKEVVYEKEYAEENGWPIQVDDGVRFEAYKKGYYATGHSNLWIEAYDSLGPTDIPEQKLKLCSIKELAEYYADLIVKGCEVNKNIPDCDFAVAGRDFTTEGEAKTLEEIRDSSSGWYGMKKFNAGFDGDDLCLIADYYGGGCAVITQLFDGMDKKMAAKEIESIIVGTFNVCETAHSDTVLIVEFETEKGVENDAESI